MTLKFGIDATTLGLQRRLTQTTSEVGRSFERLSSGLRINRPSDDAAGLQISESLAAETRILNQARRNVNDGVSVLNIAESIVTEVTRIETRMAELAEQAANGALATEQRRAMNLEFFALSHEAQRIVESAEFNGINVSAGLKGELRYQQLTSTVGTGVNVSKVAVSGDGSHVAYFDETSSTLELLNVMTGETTTIANATAAASNAIEISASGQVVAFQSTQDLTGQNSSNFQQTFVYNSQTGSLEQVTNAQSAESGISGFALSADGSMLSFTSRSRYVDGGALSDGVTSGDGTDWLYLLDLSTNTFTETFAGATLEFITNASFSANSQFLTFASNGDYTGENPDNSPEVFVLNTSDPSASLREVTITAGVLTAPEPIVTSSGDVYFFSDADVTGENPSNYQQLFRYDYESDTNFQITNFDSINASTMVKSVDEGSIYIATALDLTGENPSNLIQGFEYDIPTGEITQVTSYDSVPTVLTFFQAANGSAAIMGANADLTGENSDGSLELFLVDTYNTPLDLTISLGGGADSSISISLESVKGAAKSLGGLTISSQVEARGALERIQSDLDSLGELAGKIGANMSRLGHAANELSNRALSYQDAVSRIRDVDVAGESANLTKNLIRQQSIAEVLKLNQAQGDLLLRLLKNDN